MGMKDRKVDVVTTDKPETKVAIDQDDDSTKIYHLVAQVGTNTKWKKKIINFLSNLKIENVEKQKKLSKQASRFQIINEDL